MNLRFSEKALERALKCFEVERDIHDNSFTECLKRLMGWCSGRNEDGTASYDGVIILWIDTCNDFSFNFSEERNDGRRGIRGGLLYHGKAGEKDTTLSFTNDTEHAWQIHT